MSQADVERFADEVKKNQKLQEELRGKSDPSVFFSVATKHGYNITQDDVDAYARSKNWELSGKELDAVSGGAPSGGSTTRLDPYKLFKF
jgi:predicted ribosomally synthesized peptide with nif11-like leader